MYRSSSITGIMKMSPSVYCLSMNTIYQSLSTPVAGGNVFRKQSVTYLTSIDEYHEGARLHNWYSGKFIVSMNESTGQRQKTVVCTSPEVLSEKLSNFFWRLLLQLQALNVRISYSVFPVNVSLGNRNIDIVDYKSVHWRWKEEPFSQNHL